MRVKSVDVIAEMRSRIIGGDWPPGSRIPIKHRLREHFNASDGTIQKALDALAAEGFLKSRGRLGTFIRERTPDRHRIVLALGMPRRRSIWLDTTASVAAGLNDLGRAWIDTYFACCAPDANPPGEGLIRLRQDVALGSVAGIVFCGVDPALVADPTLSRPGLARSKVGYGVGDPAIPTVFRRDATPLTMRFLRARRRRRLAVFTTFNRHESYLAPLRREAAAAGLETRRSWTHMISPESGFTARAISELLMTFPKQQRPDAIMVLDDHLTSFVSDGIADARVATPDDLDLVSLANFPHTKPVKVPTTFIGHDIDAELRLAISQIDEQLAGNAMPSDIWMEPTLRLAKGIPAELIALTPAQRKPTPVPSR